MSNHADTGTSREGDPYAEIAALRQRVAELERELEAARKVIGAAILWDARCNKVREPRGSDVVSYYDCSFEETRDFKAALAAYRATTTKEPRDEEAE